MKKFKIKSWLEYHYFYNCENIGKYYIVFFLHYDVFKLHIFYKINTILYNIIFIFLFFYCYYYDLKIMTLFFENLKIILYKNIIIKNLIINFLHYILYIWTYIKIEYVIIFIIILLFFIYILKYKKLKEYILIFIYQRINFIINSYIFLYFINISIKDYIEYNFIFIIIITLFIIINNLNYLLRKKNLKKMEISHFLSLPYILIIIFFILYWLNLWVCLEILNYIYKLNKRYFILKLIEFENKPVCKDVFII